MKRNKGLSNKGMWDRFHTSKLKNIYPNPRLNYKVYERERIFKMFLPHNIGNLIEIGCGSSVWLPYFKNKGYGIYGIDYSEEGCIKADTILKKNNLSGNIFCQDIRNIDPQFYNKFDVMISFGLIEHYESPQEIISIFKKLLKDNGTMIIFIPNKNSIAGRITKYINPKFHKTHKILTIEEFREFHDDMAIIYSGFIRFMDFSMINLQRVPKKISTLIGVSITFLNLIIRRVPLIGKIQSPLFSSELVVVATIDKGRSK